MNWSAASYKFCVVVAGRKQQTNKKKSFVTLNYFRWYDEVEPISQFVSTTSGVGHTILPESKALQPITWELYLSTCSLPQSCTHTCMNTQKTSSCIETNGIVPRLLMHV